MYTFERFVVVFSPSLSVNTDWCPVPPLLLSRKTTVAVGEAFLACVNLHVVLSLSYASDFFLVGLKKFPADHGPRVEISRDNFVISSPGR